MKAVILAAGMGTRIRPLTDTVPKPMIPIVNRPVMEFLVDLLRQHGFDEIVITTSYLASHIESYFGDGAGFGVQIAYSFEGHHHGGEVVPEGLGAAGGLKRVQEWSGFLDGTFAVLCGDAIIDLDLTRAVAEHRAKGSIATLLLKDIPRAEVGRYGVVETAADGRILRFQEKPRPEDAVSTTINTGVYLFEPEALDHIPGGRAVDIAREFFPALIEKGLPFYGVTLPFTWIDVGHTSDYWQATQRVLRGELSFIRMPGRELAPGIHAGINVVLDPAAPGIRGPLYVGSGTRIEPGATIVGPTVIGRDCLVQSGARVEACVIGDHTRISGFADVKEKVISGRFCVDRHGHNVDLAQRGYAFVIDDLRERREWSEDQESLMQFLNTEVPRTS